MIEIKRMHFPVMVQDTDPPRDGEYVIRWRDNEPCLLARYENKRRIIHSSQRDIRRGTPVFYQRMDDDLFDGGNR